MRDQVEISGTRYSVAERIAVGEIIRSVEIFFDELEISVQS